MLAKTVAARLHVVLKDDGSADLVDKSLIAARRAAQPSDNHGLMSQSAGEAFIIEYHRDIGHSFLPTIDKLMHTFMVFTRLSVGLTGVTHHDTFHLLTTDIGL